MRTRITPLLLLAGCPATSVYRSADPVAPGRWRVGGAITGGVYRDSEQRSRVPVAALELDARRGVRPDLDLGARLSTAGLDLDATWRFAHGRWSWALAPDLGGLRTGDTALSPPAIDLFAQTALIGSRALSRRWTLSVGPSIGGGLYWPETGGHASGLWLGGFVNAGVRLGAWTLAPELSILRVVAGDVPVHGSGALLGVGLARDL